MNIDLSTFELGRKVGFLATSTKYWKVYIFLSPHILCNSVAIFINLMRSLQYSWRPCLPGDFDFRFTRSRTTYVASLTMRFVFLNQNPRLCLGSVHLRFHRDLSKEAYVHGEYINHWLLASYG